MSHNTQSRQDTEFAGASGLLIVGCSERCGKTVVTTGLAATLLEEGFPVRAIKPICLGARRQAESELFFMSTIARSPLTYPLVFVEQPASLRTFQLAEVLRSVRQSSETTLIELPGSAATPISLDADKSRWLDVGDLAAQLAFPVLLVAAEGTNVVEQLILNATYLLSSSMVNVVGLVAVAVTDQPGHAETATLPEENRAIVLKQRVGVPYLGSLKFSPSISVPMRCQGNLIKTTSAALDLLPIIAALNLRISV